MPCYDGPRSSFEKAWAALQLGPAMPVAWVDDFFPKEALGFEL